LAIDDFGTGFSSLSYLSQLPVQTLKVAKPFVDALVRSDKEAAFTHAIVRLGQTAQLRLIAEGIELLEQLDSLKSVDCDMGQGYLLGRPKSAADLEEFLAGRLVPPRPATRSIA
ncbi:MAG: EAL domain-containing protein, partial [Acidimicrobiales bacterium]